MSDPRFVSNTPPPPPSHPSSAPYSGGPSPHPPSSNNQLRNVIIGAAITVFSSVLIYYLTVYMNRNKSESGSSEYEQSKATSAAWKSYLAYENTYTRNMLSFEKDMPKDGIDSYNEGMHKESGKFTNDLADLSKGKNIDKDLVKAFNRRLENEANSLAKATAYFQKIKIITAEKGNAQKIRAEFMDEQLRWSQYYKGAYERAINDIEEIAKILSERYGQAFSMSDFLIVQMMPQRMKSNDSLIAVLQNIEVDSAGYIISNKNVPTTVYAKNVDPKDIAGTWNADGDVFSLLPNGKMTWVLEDGSRASGNWKLENDKLKVNAVLEKTNQKQMWIFNLSNITGSSFTITLDASPYNTYNFVRIN